MPVSGEDRIPARSHVHYLTFLVVLASSLRPRLISLDSFACCLRHTTCRCLVTHAYTIFESLHPNHACWELDLTSWSRSQSNTRRISSPPPRQVVSTHCLRRHARHLRPKYAHNFYKRLTIWHVPNSLARPHNHNSRYTARQPEQIANQLTLRIGVSCFRRSSQAAVTIVVQRKFRVEEFPLRSSQHRLDCDQGSVCSLLQYTFD